MKTIDIAVIGAGPAGISASIQLKRYGVDTILFEKNGVGGLLRNANFVENYPGFPRGISGGRLVSSFKKHLDALSISILFEEVLMIDLEDEMKRGFIIETAYGFYRSNMAVVASGTKPKKAASVMIPDNVKDNIYYEILPIITARRKTIIIAGGGDAAFDYALNLGRHNKVIILNRTGKTRCLPLLRERASLLKNITYHENVIISGVAQSPGHGLQITCSIPGGITVFFADYLIFAVGREPQLDFLSKKVKNNIPSLQKKGILYFAGDVHNGDFRQTAIAAGEGIMAAMKIHRIMEVWKE